MRFFKFEGTPEEVEIVYHVRNHALNRPHLRSGHKRTTKDDAVKLVERMKQEPYFWTIRGERCDGLVGYGGIGNYNMNEQRGELYFVIDPDAVYDEKPVLDELISYIMKILGVVTRLDVVVYAYCTERIEMMNALGFKNEGRKERVHFWKGQMHDELLFGLIRE